MPSLLSRVCFSDSHLSRVLSLCLCSTAEQSLLLICASSAHCALLSTAQQSLLLLYATSAQLPLKNGEVESKIGVQFCFHSISASLASHVGCVGGAVHNRAGGILHFSFVIQTDRRVVFFHNPEQAMQWQSTFLS